MRIHIKAQGRSIRIPIPTGLVFGKLSVWLYLKLARKYTAQYDRYLPEDTRKAGCRPGNIPDEAVFALCEEIMRLKRKYGQWNLVDIQSADGQEVHILL